MFFLTHFINVTLYRAAARDGFDLSCTCASCAYLHAPGDMDVTDLVKAQKQYDVMSCDYLRRTIPKKVPPSA